jgi:hypothetical protein
MKNDAPFLDLRPLCINVTDEEFAAMVARAEAEDRRSGRPFLYNEKAIGKTSRPQKQEVPTREAGRFDQEPTKTRKKRLAKIIRAEDALGVAIRAAERQAAKEDLPTAWFHDALANLVKLAKEAA